MTWDSSEVAWGGLARRHHPHRGTHLPNRGVVPLQQTARHHPQGAFDPQALLCTDPAVDPIQILQWFVLRWQLEAPFRRCGPIWAWKPNASGPTWPSPVPRPVLLGLFSWTTLAAHALQKRHPMTQRKATWYDKPSPTFVDAIALVRRHLWLASEGFSLSAADPDTQELPVALYHRLVDSLAYAA